MKRNTTALTIGIGCVLLATSGCTASQNANNNIGCSIGGLAGGFGCAIGIAAVHTLSLFGTIEKKVRGIRDDYDPITTEPVVVRWDVTYAPLPTTGDTPAQPEPTTIPIPPLTPYNSPSKNDTSTP